MLEKQFVLVRVYVIDIQNLPDLDDDGTHSDPFLKIILGN